MKNKKISIWHLLWIIPLVILITILSWQLIIINPTDKMHWDLTFACMEDLYNLTIN